MPEVFMDWNPMQPAIQNALSYGYYFRWWNNKQTLMIWKVMRAATGDLILFLKNVSSITRLRSVGAEGDDLQNGMFPAW